MQNLPKRLHVIGICGVATSALAIAFHKRGVKVTGSDKGFFPPVSTELENQKVPFYAGWHPEKMIEHGMPDIIIVGTASGSQNPETIYAKEHNIPLYSFAEAIGKYFAKENCIIAAGTWGKTSSSALLSFILTESGIDPTYMFGGVSLSHTSSAQLTESNWSVFEGDEYKSSPTDPKAKFFYYKPTHVLLTAVSWDHADLYPTEVDYFNAFKKLLAMLPVKGFIVIRSEEKGIKEIISSYKGKIIEYGPKSENQPLYSYHSVKQNEQGLSFIVNHKNDHWTVNSPMLGTYQAENITGCFAMAREIGIEPNTILRAISRFKGLKRRMEKRLDAKNSSNGITIIDDIAHSPEKSISVLENLKNIYKGKVLAVFEPNIGGRQREAVKKYDRAFKNADMVIIPKLTKLKVAEEGGEQPIEGDELAKIIEKTHSNVHYISEDDKLVDFLISTAKKDDVIAFLGSHGFRNMIEQAVEKLA